MYLRDYLLFASCLSIKGLCETAREITLLMSCNDMLCYAMLSHVIVCYMICYCMLYYTDAIVIRM